MLALAAATRRAFWVQQRCRWMGSLGGFSRCFLRCGRKSIRWMLAACHVGGCVCLAFGFILLLALEIKASCSLTLLPSPAVFCLWPFITNLADSVKCLNKLNHKDYSNPEVNCPETSNSSLTYCAIHTTSLVAIPAFHRAQKRETFTQLRGDRGKQSLADGRGSLVLRLNSMGVDLSSVSIYELKCPSVVKS